MRCVWIEQAPGIGSPRKSQRTLTTLRKQQNFPRHSDAEHAVASAFSVGDILSADLVY